MEGDALDALYGVVRERVPEASYPTGDGQITWLDDFHRRLEARLAQIPPPGGWPQG